MYSIELQVVHAKTNCDGFVEQGITFPSTEAQRQLIKDVLTEANINPASIDYIEAHGTGNIQEYHFQSLY